MQFYISLTKQKRNFHNCIEMKCNLDVIKCYVMLCYVMLCYVMFTWREEDPMKADHPSAIRLATSRPLGERSEPCLAAKRPTASDEVARGRPAPHEIRRRTFLKVYSAICFLYSVYMQWVVLVPSARIFLVLGSS